MHLLAVSAPLGDALEDIRLIFQDASMLPCKTEINKVVILYKVKSWNDKSIMALDAVGLAERAT
ncbi:aliphatic sulfonate ABC transporter ATP-binding protein, partial [Erwinia amylovora]|nr:aliphatic sulfonate ABC transporter ATP-binding protein [Erwinia amylovora]